MPGRSTVKTIVSEMWVAFVAVLALLVMVMALAACSSPAAAPTAAPKPAEATKAPAAAGQPTAAPAAAQPTAAPAKKVDYPTKSVTMYAPSKPGSGFDTTARAVVATIEKEKLVPVSMPVQNASGSVEGVADMVQNYKGKDTMIGVNSITLLLNKSSGMSPYSHKDLTPIAPLIATNYGFIVRADSKYKNLMELMNDLKNQPEKTPLCGGQSDDRIAYGASAVAAGADIKKINYAAFAGGTEAAASLLEGTPAAEITTVDDILGLIESGKLRVLATSGGTRLSGIFKDVPTFKEAGLNLDWSNFRYLIAGPQYPDYAVAYWKDIAAKMVKTPTWKEQLEKFRWVDIYTADDINKYMDEKAALIDKVSADLGLKK